MSAVMGKDSSVRIGANKILGLGTWAIAGVSSDMLEDTEFGDEYKTYLLGLKDGGTVTFAGYFDPGCTSQEYLRDANAAGSNLTNLRFYVNEPSAAGTSYFEPDSSLSAGASHVNITAWEVSADKGGLVQINFTGKVSGRMAYVG